MTCRVTFAYRDLASSTDNGWTESFYTNATSAEIAMDAVSKPVTLNQRLAFLPSSYMLAFIKAQNITNRFDNVRRRFNQQTGIGQFLVGGRNQPEGEAPWMRLLVKLAAGTATTRLFQLGGLTSDVIGENLEYQAPARWDTLATTWLESLGQNPQAYQLRHSSVFATFAGPTSITVQPDKRGLVLTYPAGTAPAGLAAVNLVKLVGVQSATPISGLWRIAYNDTTNVTLFPRRRTIYGTPTPPVKVQVIQYSYATIDDFTIIRGSERRAGRPSDQLRGRARVRQG